MIRRTCLTLSSLIASLLLLPTLSARAQVVQNGDFEAVQIGSPFFSSNLANVPNWTHGGTVGDGPLWAVGYSDAGGSITVAGSGNQFVTLGGGGAVGTASWSQTVTGFTPGSPYVLNFKQASETNVDTQTITVDFPSGSSTTSQNFTTGPGSANYWRTWSNESMTFVPNASSVTLRFTSTTIHDVGLDSVSVALASTTPEPGALSLLVSMGLSGAFALRRRKKAV